ncbi:UPF0175 family protein [Anaerolineales bacterium HSG6]|nr:UPF0175 family protein [Anaerolineales bacterium HSG6]MDM8531654.1 UPF0175 family protein [Anaerolineales bacterium HSG25]
MMRELTSSKVTISVMLPQSLLFDYGLSQQEASIVLLRAFVLMLYRQDRISSGKAARLLGIPRLVFIQQVLAQENIPYLDYSAEELEAEVATIEQWPKK